MSNQQISTTEVSWKFVLKIWWAFLWRFIIMSEGLIVFLVYTLVSLFSLIMGRELREIESMVLLFGVTTVVRIIVCVLLFRLILFKNYKGFVLRIVSDDDKWKVCRALTWSFYWRFWIFGLILSSVIGGISGVMLGLLGARDLMPIIIPIYAYLIQLLLSLLLLRLVLQKRFRSFSIQILKTT